MECFRHTQLVKKLKCVKRPARLVEGLEGMSYEKNAGDVQPEEKAESHLIALCSSLRRGRAEGSAGLFSLGTVDKTCRNVKKLSQGMFRMDIRNNLFTVHI